MTDPRDQQEETRAVVGWDGLRFLVPGDWNVTGVSADRGDGYLKVDSPGTMFLQVKWTDPSVTPRARTLADMIGRLLRAIRKAPASTTSSEPPDLRAVLDAYLKDTSKRAKRAGETFNCKIKPESVEAHGTRIAHHFSWSGTGVGQGKIWYCQQCRRTIIAQVVGQGKDPVADVAASVFGDIHDHPEDGWCVWAAFDLVASIPDQFRLRSHQFMSGYLKLDFFRAGQGRITVERWGLANIARKKFTLQEWLDGTARADRYRPDYGASVLNGHEGVVARGAIRGVLGKLQAMRDALPSLRPATVYESCVWECDETNKLYVLQTWRPRNAASILGDLVVRCECH